MNEQFIYEYIGMADAQSIDKILDTAFNRRRELFPDWDMTYFALPKNNPVERRMILEQALDMLMRE